MTNSAIIVAWIVVILAVLGSVAFLLASLRRLRKAMREIPEVEVGAATSPTLERHKLIAEYHKAALAAAAGFVPVAAVGAALLGLVLERAKDEEAWRKDERATQEAAMAAANDAKATAAVELRTAKYREDTLQIDRERLEAERDMAQQSMAHSLNAYIDDHYRRIIQEARVVTTATMASHDLLSSMVSQLQAYQATKTSYPFPTISETTSKSLSDSRESVREGIELLGIGIRRLSVVLPANDPSRVRLDTIEAGIRECGLLVIACAEIGEVRAHDDNIREHLKTIGHPRERAIFIPVSEDDPAFNKSTGREYGIDITNSDAWENSLKRLTRRRDALRILRNDIWTFVGAMVPSDK